ncbi:uncharacterized protein K452DRAFT_304413 [Aplosporella prunicola CBS 121167]|uniref:Uncharacterized protein n=1 Tax=Aplosporella prunicola CBS 121167 TaxID=1176127 RepID=A0A6A6BQS1_9PEZI|nr:uncharacterized protein K452DRAFT_304413 [Aplosporella prunicola CBS 121167]KAF2146436.1 hypothetical protein K452DRAFT_304413 [Aplosporella prunicola CBS 121167]
MTSLAVTLGSKAGSLISLGVGLSDVALLIKHGRTVGNWLRAADNDAELVESIRESFDDILTRRGLVDLARMESLWGGQLRFIYKGEVKDGSNADSKNSDAHLERFTWLMASIVTAIDLCLPPNEVDDVLKDTIFKALRGEEQDDQLRSSLDLQLHNNIASWRSVGNAHQLLPTIHRVVAEARLDLLGEQAVPQLNRAEKRELIQFLLWLLGGENHNFNAISATIYSVAHGIRAAGIHLCVGENLSMAEQPTVRYAKGDILELYEFSAPITNDVHIVAAQQNCFPVGEPKQMIEALPVSRTVRNVMTKYWDKGAEAARKVRLTVNPFDPAEVSYHIQSFDECTHRYESATMFLAEAVFPVDSAAALDALESLVMTLRPEVASWLRKATETKPTLEQYKSPSEEQLAALCYYQSIVFGYYYQLVSLVVDMSLVQEKTYLRALWGLQDCTMLRNCHNIARWYRDMRGNMAAFISRPSLLYLLAVMFAAQTPTTPSMPDDPLVAIMGPISVVSRSLLNVYESPEEISKIAVASLPIINLMADQSAELFAVTTASVLEYSPINEYQTKELVIGNFPTDWTIHPVLSADKTGLFNRVALAARCAGVLIGTIAPDLADATLIWRHASSLKLRSSRLSAVDRSALQRQPRPQPLRGIEVLDSDFRKGLLPRSMWEVILVQSYGSATMRYAAVAFYGNGLRYRNIANLERRGEGRNAMVVAPDSLAQVLDIRTWYDLRKTIIIA